MIRRNRRTFGPHVLLRALLLAPIAWLAGGAGAMEVAYRLYGLDLGLGRNGQPLGSLVSPSEVWAQIELVSPLTLWVRLYSARHGNETAAKLAKAKGLKVAMTIFLTADSAANEAEFQAGVELAKQGYVDVLIVGSECLLRHDVTETQLLDFMARAKAAVPQIPVTTSEVYNVLLTYPNVIAACDELWPNIFPYWETYDVRAAIAALDQAYRKVVAAAGGRKVVIGESGWRSFGSPNGAAVPSVENAAFYFVSFVSWARANSVPYFYFAAFDEPAKGDDDGWGLHTADGDLKLGFKAVFDGVTVPDYWSGTQPAGGPGTAGICFTGLPPYGTVDGFVSGQVMHVAPANCKVVIIIHVPGAGYWSKPTFDAPATAVQPDGSWRCDIVTGGYDECADQIIAYLVPADYDPPLASGEASPPAPLEANALAKALTTRSQGNQAPTVSAGADAAVVLPAAAQLNGTASDDGLPGGNMPVLWSQVNGPGTATFANSAALSTTVSFSQAGYYLLRLTATDGQLFASATVSVRAYNASDYNQSPVVTAGPAASPSPAPSGQPAAFTVTANDPDGDTLSYTWNFGDNTTGTGASPGHTYSIVGTYEVALVITDGRGGSETRTLQLEVSQGAVAFTSQPAAVPNPATAGTAVQFSAAAQADSPISWIWDFGDGTVDASNKSALSHVYSSAGAYTVTVMAATASGRISTTLTVTVVSPPGPDGGGDSDGDGFPDEMETALHTSPNDPQSTPFDGTPAGAAVPLTIKKMSIGLDLTPGGTGFDYITLSGALPVPAGILLPGQQVVVSVGGVVRSFTYDSKGRTLTGQGSLKLRPRTRHMITTGRLARFQGFFFARGFAGSLSDEGLVNADVTNLQVTVPVIILFGKTMFRLDQPLRYMAHADEWGFATKPRR